jgi:hypothetical protein
MLTVGAGGFAPIFGCVGCLNQGIGIKYPFIDNLLALFAGWIVVSQLVRFVVRKKYGSEAIAIPAARMLKPFIWAGVLVAVGALLLWGRALGLLLIAAWLGCLATTLVAACWWRRWAVHAAPFLFANALAVILAAVIAPYSYKNARSAEGMVNSLGNPLLSITSTLVIPGVITYGPSAVDPLIEAIERELASESPQPYRLSQLCYCLGQIGGTDAENYLKRLVNERISFADKRFPEWHAVAACAFADCAGPRAVPDLIAIHRKWYGNIYASPAVISLVALVRTADRNAIAYVLDDKYTLFIRDPTGYGDPCLSRLAYFTLEALLHGKSASDLTSDHLYAVVRVGIDVDEFGKPARIGFHHTTRRQTGNRNELEALWRKQIEKIRHRWDSIL